jgi:hypothetical protein
MNSPALRLTRTDDWQPDQIVVFEATNTGDVMVNLDVALVGETNEVHVRVGIFPGWPTRLAIPLRVASGGTLFLPRTPGRFKAVVQGANLDFADLREIRIAPVSGAEELVTFGGCELRDEMPTEYPLPAEPLVDDMHQWRSRDWPGKARHLDEVRDVVQAELAVPEPCYPKTWSAYGGWRRTRFSATGYFRTEHDGKRWWLVDPEGCAFWSIGVDCVRAGNTVNVSGIEAVFSPPLPGPQEAPELWQISGDYRQFDAGQHNLRRVFGPDWLEQWADLSRHRLHDYCFNTIGNWSDRLLQCMADIPYVFTMSGFPTTETKLFRDFPDVFDPTYEGNARRFAGQLAEIRDDRFVIGYFMTNEPKWAFVNGLDLGQQILRDSRRSASRDVLVENLRGKYGSITALNAAWDASFAAWSDLAEAVPAEVLARATDDTLAFTEQAVARFVTLPAKACREADPNHLNLGLRWAWIHSDYQLAGHEWLDAFSINCYQLRPDPEMIARLVEKTGKPVMIGEYHIGALDRGLPSGGIRNTRRLSESVEAYRYYIENAAAIPGLVGAHYFKWDDQHVMGRNDGENMQIGLHDITGRAYAEWVEMCQRIHPGLYEIANGDRTPFDQEPPVVPDGTLCW